LSSSIEGGKARIFLIEGGNQCRTNACNIKLFVE